MVSRFFLLRERAKVSPCGRSRNCIGSLIINHQRTTRLFIIWRGYLGRHGRNSPSRSPGDTQIKEIITGPCARWPWRDHTSSTATRVTSHGQSVKDGGRGQLSCYSAAGRISKTAGNITDCPARWRSRRRVSIEANRTNTDGKQRNPENEACRLSGGGNRDPVYFII